MAHNESKLETRTSGLVLDSAPSDDDLLSHKQDVEYRVAGFCISPYVVGQKTLTLVNGRTEACFVYADEIDDTRFEMYFTSKNYSTSLFRYGARQGR